MYSIKNALRHLSLLLLLSSCAIRTNTNIIAKNNTLPYDSDVHVFNINETIPDNLKKIGTISIGDSGFTMKCDYQLIIEKAELEARKAGANIIKITEHKTPDLMSSCHRIKANLYFIKDLKSIIKNNSTSEEQQLLDVDYALLHVYRYSGQGALVGYDLKLGDSTLCRVKNNFKTTIKLTEKGLNKIWAKTESKVELPIDVVFGKQYYLKCGIKMGVLVGKPTLEFVDYKTGKIEFETFDAKH